MNHPSRRKGASSVKFTTDKDGNKNVEIHNHTYLFADTVYLTPGKDSNATAFLIAQDVSSTVITPSDTPPTVKLNAQAFSATEGFPRQPAWTIETEGNSGEIEDLLYAVKHDGFQDAFDTYIYFRMADGKKVYTSNTPAAHRPYAR